MYSCIKAHWLGGSDREQEGVWKWETSNELLTITDWIKDQPNNFNNQDCLTVHTDPDVDFKWNDEYCSKRLRFVCERNN